MRTAYIITKMTEAVRTSETSVYYNETTRRYIPAGYELSIYDAHGPYVIETENIIKLGHNFTIKKVSS
jgi:hypothetical protein